VSAQKRRRRTQATAEENEATFQRLDPTVSACGATASWRPEELTSVEASVSFQGCVKLKSRGRSELPPLAARGGVELDAIALSERPVAVAWMLE
jgi:hypothetical protein